MKEKPILFNTEMVRAILDGRKSQTRRVIKPQPAAQLSKIENSELWTFTNCEQEWKPKYQPGDRLWVRETWKQVEIDDQIGTRIYPPVYKADEPPYQGGDCHWEPPIFMPKKYARIWLEVLDVRVERVKQMKLGEMISEGIKKVPDGEGGINWTVMMSRMAYLWDSINKKRGYSWELNPWVWVYEFKRIKPKEVER